MLSLLDNLDQNAAEAMPFPGDASFTSTLLIYRLGSLGDTLVSLPCFHKIAERFPTARRLVLTNRPISRAAPRLLDILDGTGLVHGAIEYDLSLRSPSALVGLRSRLRSTGADTLCYLAAPRGRMRLWRDLAFFRLCGIKRVIGAPLTADLRQTRIDPGSEEIEYECERLARCIAELGPLDLDRRSAWDLRLSVDEQNEASEALAPLANRPFIAVNMGGKWAENDWGEPKWRELFAFLSREWASFGIAVVGGASDAARAMALAAVHPWPVLNLCGRSSLRVTAAVLSRASLFIGHDSGPLHLAATCGVPCVGIFGTTNKPHKWHPYGPGHRVIHPTVSIATISVSHVCEAVTSTLNVTRSRGNQLATFRGEAAAHPDEVSAQNSAHGTSLRGA